MKRKSITKLFLAFILLTSVVVVCADDIVVDHTETAQYVVFKDSWNGNIYFAKNGATGEVELIDNDASTVIQYAVDMIDANNGGILYLRSGEYKIYSTIYLCKEIAVRGSGWNFGGGGTKLKLKANCDVFYLDHPKTVSSVGIYDLSIVAQKNTYTTGSGIYFSDNTMDCRIKDVGMNYMPEYGIYAGSGWGLVIDDVVVEHSGLDGIHIGGRTDGKIVNSKILGNDGYGIYASSTQMKIIGNEIRGNHKEGLYMRMGKQTCMGNTFHKNYGGDSDSQIHIVGNGNSVVGNSIDCKGTSSYGIVVSSSAEDAVVTNNFITRFNDVAVVDEGDNSLIDNNQGYPYSSKTYIPSSDGESVELTFDATSNCLVAHHNGNEYYYNCI